MRWWPCWTWTPCSPSSPSSSPSTSVSPHLWSPPRCQPKSVLSFECPPSCRSVARLPRTMQWWTTLRMSDVEEMVEENPAGSFQCLALLHCYCAFTYIVDMPDPPMSRTSTICFQQRWGKKHFQSRYEECDHCLSDAGFVSCSQISLISVPLPWERECYDAIYNRWLLFKGADGNKWSWQIQINFQLPSWFSEWQPIILTKRTPFPAFWCLDFGVLASTWSLHSHTTLE